MWEVHDAKFIFRDCKLHSPLTNTFCLGSHWNKPQQRDGRHSVEKRRKKSAHKTTIGDLGNENAFYYYFYSFFSSLSLASLPLFFSMHTRRRLALCYNMYICGTSARNTDAGPSANNLLLRYIFLRIQFFSSLLALHRECESAAYSLHA